MSQMSEMAQTIEDLRIAAATIKEAADWLAQQFSAPAEEQPAEDAPAEDSTAEDLPAQDLPVEEPQVEAPTEIKLEQIRAVLADKSRAGHTAAIRELLKKYDATKLSQVDPKHYAAILKETEGWSDAT